MRFFSLVDQLTIGRSRYQHYPFAHGDIYEISEKCASSNGAMAEWSKAVVLSTTGEIRVGSNPTRTNTFFLSIRGLVLLAFRSYQQCE
jgi:hypothetical protein